MYKANQAKNNVQIEYATYVKCKLKIIRSHLDEINFVNKILSILSNQASLITRIVSQKIVINAYNIE